MTMTMNLKRHNNGLAAWLMTVPVVLAIAYPSVFTLDLAFIIGITGFVHHTTLTMFC